MKKKTAVTENNSLSGKSRLQSATVSTDDKPVQPPGYDPVEFEALLRCMKGTRTVREFAMDTGLSESFVSKAVSGLQKSRPSKRTVLKLMRARSEAKVDRREIVRAAGYEEQDLETPFAMETALGLPSSTVARINWVFGEDHFTAMKELLKALSEHEGLKGVITCCIYRQDGYFEVTDKMTEQTYVGINAYFRPVVDEGKKENHLSDVDKEYRAVIAIAFSAGKTYSHVINSEYAKEKIVYILTDNERIYHALCDNLPKNMTKATVVVLTEDHQGFCKEYVLDGAEAEPISLVD